jgi:hypothetical protein
MTIDLIAPDGCGIKRDKRLKKVVFRAENVKDQEELYELMERVKIFRGKYLLDERARPEGQEKSK